MPTATIRYTASIGGLAIDATVERTATGQIGQEVSLAAAAAGSLTTRTNDTAGTLTMTSESHGIETGDVIDIFWTGGVAYSATAGEVDGTSVPFTDASGDALPAQDTAVVADVVQEIDVDFDGDLVEAIALTATRRGYFDFQNDTPASLENGELLAGEPWHWVADTGPTNPLTGDPVDKLLVSNGSSDGTNVVQLGLIYNSDE